jgi:hypothetical protein
MRSEIKRLFMGFIYSLMTFSFIMAPIPVVNVAFAEGSDFTQGQEDRRKIYKKGEDFDEIREKTTLQKYSEESGGLVALLQQLTTGLMGITLLNAIKYKYTYENNPILYGNDCGPNNAAKVTIRVAQLGSLMYLIGDITANFQYSKSARLAAEEFEESGWTPQEKANFEDMTDEEKAAREENEQASNAAEEQNYQIKGFNTMIGLLEDKESAIKTKRALTIAASVAYGVSAGYEGVNWIRCAATCTAALAAKRALQSTVVSALSTAASTISAFSSLATCPGPCIVNNAVTCPLAGSQLAALAAKAGGQMAAVEAASATKQVESVATDEADKAMSLPMLINLKHILTTADSSLVGDVTKKLEEVDKAIEAAKKAQDVANAAGSTATTTQASADQVNFATLTTNAIACIQPAGGTAAPIAYAPVLNYYSYFYDKIQCCGADGTPAPLVATMLAQKKILQGHLLTLSYGGDAAQQAAKEGMKKTQIAAAKAARELAMNAGKQSLFSIFGGAFGSLGLGQAVLGGMADKVTSEVASQIAEVGSLADSPGTYPIQGIPTKGEFARKQDIELGSLFGGGGESSSIRNNKRLMPEDELNHGMPADFFEFKEDQRMFVKNNFESILRRFATKAYIETEFVSAKQDAQFLMRQEQEIKNIMFFYDQMVDEATDKQLAENNFTGHRYWKTINNLIGNLLLPKAHALSGMMIGGMAIKMIAPMLGLPPEWTEVLNIGSSLMLGQALIGGFAKKWGLVKPIGRTVTFSVMMGILAWVQDFDKKALEEVEKRRKFVIDEKNKWIKSGAKRTSVAYDSSNSTNYQSSNYSGNSRSTSQTFVKQCAVPSAGGFKPAKCPQDTTDSSFKPGKMDPIASKLMTPSLLDGMSTISNLSSKTANGTLKKSDLEGSNLQNLEKLRMAIASDNAKLVSAIDKMQEQLNKGKKKKSLPLSATIAKARRAFGGGNVSSIQGSAASFGGSSPALGSARASAKPTDSGVVEATNGDGGGSGGAAAAPSVPAFDLDLLGGDMGGVAEDGSTDSMGEESKKAEENLADLKLITMILIRKKKFRFLKYCRIDTFFLIQKY